MIFKDNKYYRSETDKDYIMGNCCGSEEPESQVDVVSNILLRSEAKLK